MPRGLNTAVDLPTGTTPLEIQIYIQRVKCPQNVSNESLPAGPNLHGTFLLHFVPPVLLPQQPRGRQLHMGTTCGEESQGPTSVWTPWLLASSGWEMVCEALSKDTTVVY